jgi:drug/metabolite transporter (DMT)-like permease
VHVLAALLGFAGAAVAILGASNGNANGASPSFSGGSWDYFLALGSVFFYVGQGTQTR